MQQLWLISRYAIFQNPSPRIILCFFYLIEIMKDINGKCNEVPDTDYSLLLTEEKTFER
jgi:hypothetical protein